MEDNKLAKVAIQAALECNWGKAVELNREILKDTPSDSEALNRLARAYFELGEVEKAKNCYSKVLEIDPANSIAAKNLKLLVKSPNGVNGQNNHNKNLKLDVFCSEPGRTKLVNLVNLATPNTLAVLTCGERLAMVVKKHQVAIESHDGKYLGAVPDDLSHYLISLTRAGNNYEAYVKAVKSNILTVIICERARATKLASQPSFLTRRQTKLPKASSPEGILTESTLEEAENFFDFTE